MKKTILFAIAMKGLDSKEAEAFEQKTLNALRTGGREFADAVSVHCDYKEGLVNVCRQYRPDCLIVNEALKGVGNIFDIVKDIKSDFPDMQITFLFKEHRAVGDVVLANLTAAGIYNWVVAPWTAESIVNSLVAPKKMKDVEMYIPKIVENANGLAFDTRVVEKVDDSLNDLPDVLGSSTNNAVKAKGVGDISDGSGENKNAPYKRVVSGGFGFGKAFKPILNEAKEEEEKDEPISMTENVSYQNESQNDSFALPGQDLISQADEEKRLADARRIAALKAEEERVAREAREAEEAARRTADVATAASDDEFKLPEFGTPDVQTEVEPQTSRRTSLLDAINAHKEMRRQLEEAEKAREAEKAQSVQEEPVAEVVETPVSSVETETVYEPVKATEEEEEDTNPSWEEIMALAQAEGVESSVSFTSEPETVTEPAVDVVEVIPETVEPAKNVSVLDTIKEPEKPAKPVKETPKRDKKEAIPTETKKLTVTLNSIKFKPKYNKVLFMRAMPISSVVPAHVCKLMNAQFVDFNKVSNNDGYFDLLRTTIKGHEMPEGELVVGDVVAGNGVENLVGLFDHVVAVLPEDAFAIEQFVSRYGNLVDGAIVDKCTTSSLTRKQLLKMVPGVKYVDTIKVDNCNKDVVQSAISHEFLMDNPEFAEGMHFFLKDIGGVE